MKGLARNPPPQNKNIVKLDSWMKGLAKTTLPNESLFFETSKRVV